jgi:hypothetical protein
MQEVNNAETDNPEARRYFQTECRKSAEEIVQFISSLRKQNFQEFWLPCTSTLIRFSQPAKVLIYRSFLTLR